MINRYVALALLASVAAGGTLATRVQAGVASPATGSIVTTEDAIRNVAWVCGATRCEWEPFNPVVRHTWTRDWGAPRTPGCYWVKRRSGRWREVCPH
jgi:hypothetical protein